MLSIVQMGEAEIGSRRRMVGRQPEAYIANEGGFALDFSISVKGGWEWRRRLNV